MKTFLLAVGAIVSSGPKHINHNTCSRIIGMMRASSSTTSGGDGLGLDDQAAASFWNNILDTDQDGFDINVAEPMHFNNAGASPSPPVVLWTVARHMAQEALLGGYLAASRAQPQLDQVYASVARLLNAKFDGDKAREEIALVESATVAWTRIFYSMAETLARNDEKLASTHNGVIDRVILMSEAEYAANVVAAVKFAREQNVRTELTGVRWRVLSLPSTIYKDEYGKSQSSGIVDLDALDDMLTGKWLECDTVLNPESITMVCITHIPTNSGIINPVNAIGDLIVKYNSQRGEIKCFYLLDACQSAGQIQIDVQKIQCHALAATGRKYLRGPRGTGFLYVQSDVANALEPSHVDHSSTPILRPPDLDGVATTASIDLTERLCYEHKQGAARFEFWESNISGKLGLGEAVNYALEEVGLDVIETKCCSLGDMLRARLRQIKGVKVYHDNEVSNNSHKQCGIVVFSVANIQPAKVKELLLNSNNGKDSKRMMGFEVSVVPATSTPADSGKTCTTDLVRASLSYFNRDTEIDLFCARLRSLAE